MPQKVMNERLPAFLMTQRIIVGALLQGTLVFLAVAIYLRVKEPEVDFTLGLSPISVAAVVVAILVVLAQPLVARWLVARSRQQIADGTWNPPGGHSPADSYIDTGDTGRLMAVYQTKTIVSCAMLEGAAFFATIAVLMEGAIICLVVAVALMVAIAARFPFERQVSEWIEQQHRLIDDARGFTR
ncbi:MAG: hypothetical protein KF708_05000 [Pirellulales bacterium]|nr:hypothetical protein [Pirellulales bacterium]